MASTTSTSPRTSTTWRSCCGPRTDCRRPSRSTAGRWRSTSGRSAPTTPTSRPTSTTWRSYCSRSTNRSLTEAEPLTARAVRILLRFQQSTGHEHPDLRAMCEELPQSSHPTESSPVRRSRRGSRQRARGRTPKVVADRSGGGTTSRPGQDGGGCAGISGSPVQGAGQAGHLFPQAGRTDRAAPRRVAPADRRVADRAGFAASRSGSLANAVVLYEAARTPG